MKTGTWETISNMQDVLRWATKRSCSYEMGSETSGVAPADENAVLVLKVNSGIDPVFGLVIPVHVDAFANANRRWRSKC